MALRECIRRRSASDLPDFVSPVVAATAASA